MIVSTILPEDDWKVTRTFTLNLGVRYNYFSPIVGKHFAAGQL